MVEIERIITFPMEQNAYILFLEGGTTSVVIDPSFNVAAVLSSLKSLGLGCEAILLTHGHFDHIAGVEELRNTTGARVYIHKNDAGMLEDPEKNMSTLIGRTIKTPPAEYAFEGDADFLLAGIHIRAIETPGHSGGSVCYLAEDALFSGDTLFYMNIGRTDLYASDPTHMEASLAKLKELKKDYRVYPGHGQSTSLFHEIDSNPYLGDEKWSL